MLLSTQLEVDPTDLILSAKIDNSKNLLQLLKAINFKDSATVICTGNGLKVTVEEAKCLQANAFIQAEMFQEYSVTEDMVTFKINLNALVECLNIFGGTPTPNVTPVLKLCYNGAGSPLRLILVEGGVVTDCKITTMDADDTLEFNFTAANVINKVIMRSDGLREVFSELDLSSELLEITINDTAPHFRFSTFGNYGTSHTDIPRDSEIMETFQCTARTTHRYKFSLLKPSIKALSVSQKVSLRVDDRGFLCMQFMVHTEDQHTAFVEFFCCPEEEID